MDFKTWHYNHYKLGEVNSPESNTVIYDLLSISPRPTYDCVNIHQLIIHAFLLQFPPFSVIHFCKQELSTASPSNPGFSLQHLILISV